MEHLILFLQLIIREVNHELTLHHKLNTIIEQLTEKNIEPLLTKYKSIGSQCLLPPRSDEIKKQLIFRFLFFLSICSNPLTANKMKLRLAQLDEGIPLTKTISLLPN